MERIIDALVQFIGPIILLMGIVMIAVASSMQWGLLGMLFVAGVILFIIGAVICIENS